MDLRCDFQFPKIFLGNQGISDWERMGFLSQRPRRIRQKARGDVTATWQAAGLGNEMGMSHEAGLESEGTGQARTRLSEDCLPKYGAEAPTVPTGAVRRGRK